MIATSDTSLLGEFAATLFALLNPVGMLPIFIGYTAHMRAGVQRWLATFISITVLGLMLLFLLAGTALLNFFGIILDAFRIAGGILLLLIGIRTVAHDLANKAKDLTVVSDAGAQRGRVCLRPDRCSFCDAAIGWTWRDRKLNSVRRRSLAKKKRQTVLGSGGRDDRGFPSDTRDSAFGQVLATTVGRCRPEHRHTHSWVARRLDWRPIRDSGFNERGSSFDRACGVTTSCRFLKYLDTSFIRIQRLTVWISDFPTSASFYFSSGFFSLC